MPVNSIPATTQTTVTPNSAVLAGSELGINLSWVNDWGDQQLTFVDVMKNARGFAQAAGYWDPVNYPVPVDSSGWPTTDFGVMFLTFPTDPLGRPVSATAPSMLGTYHLSFAGTATVTSPDCTVQNVSYNAASNTTTADVVAGATSSSVSVVFSNTNKGVQNVHLLRPGYSAGTTQVFTDSFLNAVKPFSTLRFMDFTQTNANPVTSWAQRTSASDPVQSGPAGVAWEYAVQLANATGKDIWINIPEGANLNDTSSNNYVTQLATLLKSNLNPAVHVYVEYSNELWNGIFQQTQDNLTAAQSAASSGADKTLNYDNINNEYYWANRRAAEQTVKISQLFQNVYGSAAMNTTVRPVLPSQYAQPYYIEDSLAYIQANFGAPKNYLYAVGGAPYFALNGNSSSVNSLYTSLDAGLSATLAGFTGPAYTGGIDYSVSSYKSIADFYGLKTVAYEGGPDFGYNNTSNPVTEQALSDPRLNQMVQKELSTWYADGNDLFMYYELAGSPGNYYGAYEDPTLPTQKSSALATVSSTPLSSYTSGIDTTPPSITAVTASPTNVHLGTGAAVTIVLSISKAVQVVGTPTLSLNDGGVATYAGGSGTNALTFTYTVAAGQNTSALAVTSVTLPNGATIKDAAGNTATLAGAVTTLAGPLVIDTTTTVPVVTEKLFADTGKSNTDLITSKSALTGTAGVNAVVTLLENGLKLGTAAANASGVWNWTSITLAEGAHTIVAKETNQAGASGTASLTFSLDTSAPKVTKVTATPANADLGIAKAVTFKLSMSEAVAVTGVPVLSLNDGGTASYTGGSGTSTLTFRYTVAAGQNTTDLAVTGASLPSGVAITDAAGNQANLSGAVVNPSGRLIVDTARTRINIANGNGRTVNAGAGNDVVVLSAGQATLNFHGSNNMAFLGGGTTPVNATINDTSSGLTVFVLNAGNDVINGFGSDPSAVVDLLGGIGGYASVANVVAALSNDGTGGTTLTIGSGQAIDFANVAMGTLNSSNFRIG